MKDNLEIIREIYRKIYGDGTRPWASIPGELYIHLDLKKGLTKQQKDKIIKLLTREVAEIKKNEEDEFDKITIKNNKIRYRIKRGNINGFCKNKNMLDVVMKPISKYITKGSIEFDDELYWEK